MKRIFFLVVVLILSIVQLQAQWVQANNSLYGQNVYAIAVLDQYVFAGTQAGIFRSSDQGKSWEIINNGLTDLNVTSIVANDNKLYAGTINGDGVHISTDMGNNWVCSKIGLCGYPIYVKEIFTSGNNIIVTTSSHIVISTNNGRSWKNKNILGVSSAIMKDNDIYMVLDYSSINRSSDLAETWIKLNFPPKTRSITSLAVVDNNLIAGTYSGIYLSTDDGNSWVQKNNGLSGDTVITKLATNGKIIYAGTNFGGIYVSSDNGDNWLQKKEGMGISYVTSITINEDDIFVGTGQVNEYDFIPGIFHSSNQGDIWTKLSSDLNYKVIPCIVNEGKKIVAAEAIDYIYISTNNGYSWSRCEKLDSISRGITSVQIKDGIIYVGTNGGGFYLSTDDGKSWGQKNKGIGGLYIRSLAILKENIFAGKGSSYGGQQDRGIYLSSDYGDNWISANKELENTWVEELLTFEDNIFVGFNGGIYTSSDLGQSWIDNSKGTFKRAMKSTSVYDKSIYMGSNEGGVFYTTNTGETWNDISIDIKWSDIQSIAVSGDNIFAGTDRYGVYFSSDNGITWNQRNTGLWATNIQSMVIVGDTIFAGSYKKGIFKAGLSDFGIVGVEESNVTENLLKIYPNPAGDYITITLEPSEGFEPSEGSPIHIYNILGEKVMSASARLAVPRRINISALPKGIYFVKVGGETAKFVKM